MRSVKGGGGDMAIPADSRVVYITPSALERRIWAEHARRSLAAREAGGEGDVAWESLRPTPKRPRRA